MRTTYTLREQLKAYDEEKKFIGEYAHCFNFYDWFCQNKSLERKAKGLMSKAKKFVNLMGDKINQDNTYLWFKNNCPLYGSLYDDFRISDCDTHDVIYTVAPSLGYVKSKGHAAVYGQENDFKEPIIEAANWSELSKILKNK